MSKWMSSRTAREHEARRIFASLPAFAAFFIAVLLAGSVAAQQPTDAQRNAIRAACRSDFIANCSGVTPGGMEALTCLKQHDASLSSGCKQAISALSAKSKSSSAAPATPQPATAATGAPPAPSMPAQAPTQAQKSAIKANCRSDFMAQCSGVTPGGQAALSCLQQHSASLSPACQQSVAALGGSSAGDSAPMTKPATAPAIRSFSPREELIVMRRSCGPDFRALCRMVPLGGGRGIACLRDNFARVSPGCQRVLSSGL
jgi:hypothetical protein